MKRLLSALFGILLFSTQANADLLTTGAGSFVASGGGGGYTGPGDVVSGATVWYGLRAYNAAQATALAKAIILCTAADAACTDIHVTSTGGLNSSDITTAGCSAIDTCTIKTWYDQSGNANNATQATIADRATYTRTCTGLTSLPCAAGTINTFYVSGNLPNLAAVNYSMGGMAMRTGSTSTEQEIIYMHPSGGYVNMGFRNSSGYAFWYPSAGPLFLAQTESAWHYIQATATSSATDLSVDSTNSTSGAGVQQMTTAPMSLMGAAATGNGVVGNFFEAGIWQSVIFNTTQLGNLNSNSHTYGGY